MKGVIVLDTSLMVLLIVGSASRGYIARHKRLSAYTPEDFDLLSVIISEFSDIVLLPHIVAETSNLARQIENPARGAVQSVFQKLILSCTEFPVPSVSGAQRAEFGRFGITDAVILQFCMARIDGINPTLVTADTRLADCALSLGYSVIDYRRQFLSD